MSSYALPTQIRVLSDMTHADVTAPATQVVVYEARRLYRQCLSIWLGGQEGVALAGTASSIGTLAQMLERDSVDVVLIGLVNDHERVLAEAQALAKRYNS